MCRWLVSVGDAKFLVNSQPDGDSAISVCKDYIVKHRPEWLATLLAKECKAEKIFMESGWPITVVSAPWIDC